MAIVEKIALYFSVRVIIVEKSRAIYFSSTKILISSDYIKKFIVFSYNDMSYKQNSKIKMSLWF